MANETAPSWKPVSYRQSKMGQQNFLTSARVGVIFTYELDLSDIDTQDPAFLEGNDGGENYWNNASSTVTSRSGDTVTGNNVTKIATGTTELMIGAGIKSISVEQQINVTQENALGYFDIVETVEHNVASNQMTLDKAALRLYLLSQVGLAPWGKDVLTSPRLNAYILDTKERQRGLNVGFMKLMGLHIQSNRFTASAGQMAMENVTFKIDRIKKVKSIPMGVLAALQKQFPSIYSGVESMSQGEILQ